MNKYRFLWVYYKFYDYIYGVCLEIQQGNEKKAKDMTLSYIRRIYTEMGHATREEISKFVNKMMIELATDYWYQLKQEKEKKRNKFNT